VISSTKVSIEVPVAARALAIDSVEGQRARPCGVIRFYLFNGVAPRPARRASPEADSSARAASRSIADQTCAWVSIAAAFIAFPERAIHTASWEFLPVFSSPVRHRPVALNA
jgi:hypothetical protein